MATMSKRLWYIWNEELIGQCDRLPAVLGRASVVHSLISSYGLLSGFEPLQPQPASRNELLRFHSQAYLDYLTRHEIVHCDYMPTADDEFFGLAYDCPPVSGMYHLCATLAGGSIQAAQLLVDDKADITVNWCGGWHHAQRASAKGFCYVNDVVLLIEKLKERFRKVLYVDLDVHHGDGVQEAYYSNNTVFALSFHKYEPGFYPGTGAIDEIGNLDGRGYNCNFPLSDGYSDGTMLYVFERIFNQVYDKFKPDAIVVQCGADALALDPRGGASLTCESYGRAVEVILSKSKPTTLLGGGGYDHENVARLWTSLLALAMGVKLNYQIPTHDHWPYYGPAYTLQVFSTIVQDFNNQFYLDMCMNIIENNLKMIDAADEPQAHCSRQQIEQYPQPVKLNRIFTYKQTKRNRQPPPKPMNYSVFEFTE